MMKELSRGGREEKERERGVWRWGLSFAGASRSIYAMEEGEDCEVSEVSQDSQLWVQLPGLEPAQSF